MSSSMNSASITSENYYHHPEVHLNHLGFTQNLSEGFTDHLSLNPQHFNQGLGEPMVWAAAQPQQIVQQGVEEDDVQVVKLEHPLIGLGKPRLHWTHELHARFVRAVSELGGSFSKFSKFVHAHDFPFFFFNLFAKTHMHISCS